MGVVWIIVGQILWALLERAVTDGHLLLCTTWINPAGGGRRGNFTSNLQLNYAARLFNLVNISWTWLGNRRSTDSSWCLAACRAWAASQIWSLRWFLMRENLASRRAGFCSKSWIMYLVSSIFIPVSRSCIAFSWFLFYKNCSHLSCKHILSSRLPPRTRSSVVGPVTRYHVQHLTWCPAYKL